jgi:hypothetical protein
MASIAVRMVEDAQAELVFGHLNGQVVAALNSAGLKRSVVQRWLDQRNVPLSTASGVEAPHHPLGAPIVDTCTVVICVDPRVENLARLYADTVGGLLRTAHRVNDVGDIIKESAPDSSLTFVLLNDVLSESLCYQITTANRDRAHPLPYGFVSAFTPEHLGWLMLKTVVHLAAPVQDAVFFSQLDISSDSAVTRVLATETDEMTTTGFVGPETDQRTLVFGIRSHGAQFDTSLGDTVLCGQCDPPLPRDRIRRAPSCFHDHVCFRQSTRPVNILRAVDASPLIWLLDSCASIPLSGCAFGEASSYVFGLVAGSAIAVIGPYLDMVSHGNLNAFCEALLSVGMSMGEATMNLCLRERDNNFDKFVLIGSPDIRVTASKPVLPEEIGGKLTYHVSGPRRCAFRLAIPADWAKSPPAVVGDDGGNQFHDARWHPVRTGQHDDILITTPAPTDISGELHVGRRGLTSDQLTRLAADIRDNLDALAYIPFACHSADPDDVGRAQRIADLLDRAANTSDRVRYHSDLANLLANLYSVMNGLHRGITESFIREVSDHDVNLDAVAGNGAVLEPTLRSQHLCTRCSTALYITRGHISQRYRRSWIQCVNCSGVALTLENSPLDYCLPRATVSTDGRTLEIPLLVRNRSRLGASVAIAGLARKASARHAQHSSRHTLGARSWKRVVVEHPLDPRQAGVLSYRILVLCLGGVEMLSLKHVIEPTESTHPTYRPTTGSECLRDCHEFTPEPQEPGAMGWLADWLAAT